jgi:predicted amidophosphoribosyltransferase
MKTHPKERRLDSSNQTDAFSMFAEMAAPTTSAKRAVSVVPVPGSKAISRGDVERGSTYQMATALAQRVGGDAVPCLWWKQPMRSAHSEDGTRDPVVLSENLELGTVPEGTIVLVDDVYTTGGHLKAAEAVLRTAGHPVLLAICAARVSEQEEANMFRMQTFVIETLDLTSA